MGRTPQKRRNIGLFSWPICSKKWAESGQSGQKSGQSPNFTIKKPKKTGHGQNQSGQKHITSVNYSLHSK